MGEAQHWYNNIPLPLVLALLAGATGLGVYRAAVGYLTERAQKADKAFAELSKDIKSLAEGQIELRTVLTGITGRNGLVGDMAALKDRVQKNELSIARLQTITEE